MANPWEEYSPNNRLPWEEYAPPSAAKPAEELITLPNGRKATRAELEAELGAYDEDTRRRMTLGGRVMDYAHDLAGVAPAKLTSGLLSIPAETGANLVDLAGAAGGYLESKLTGGAPSYQPVDRSTLVGGRAQIERGLNSMGFDTEYARPDSPISQFGGEVVSQGLGAMLPGAPRAAAAIPMKATEISTDSLFAAATNAYSRASKAGVTVKPQAFVRLNNALESVLKEERASAQLHPAAMDAVNTLRKEMGTTLDIGEIQKLRQVLVDAQKGAASDADRRVVQLLKSEFDDFRSTLSPGKDLNGVTSKQAIQDLKDADNLYSRAKKSAMMEDLFHDAQLEAVRSPNTRSEETLRTAFRQLAKNDKRMRMLDPDERVAVEKIAEGTDLNNSLRVMGRLMAPTNHALMYPWLVGGVGLMQSGHMGVGAMATAIPPIGSALSKISEKMTEKNWESALKRMQRGGPNAAPLLRPRTEPELSAYGPERAYSEGLDAFQPNLRLARPGEPIPGQAPVNPATARAEALANADRMAGDLSLEQPPVGLLPAPRGPEPMVSGGARRGARGRFATRDRTPTATETQLEDYGLTPDVRSAAPRHPGYSISLTDKTEPNYSGKTPASSEALRRVEQEKAAGLQRFKIGSDGIAIPLHGVDAVDARAYPGEVIVREGPDGIEIIDRGQFPEAHLKGVLARAKRSIQESRRR